MNGCIIMCSGCKSLDREVLAHDRGNTSLVQHFQHVSVICRITNKGDTFVILRSGANERDAADVDVLYDIFIGDTRFRDRLLEGIQVDGDEVNVIPAEVKQFFMIRIGRARQQASVDGGMQCFYSTTKNFW